MWWNTYNAKVCHNETRSKRLKHSSLMNLFGFHYYKRLLAAFFVFFVRKLKAVKQKWDWYWRRKKRHDTQCKSHHYGIHLNPCQCADASKINSIFYSFALALTNILLFFFHLPLQNYYVCPRVLLFFARFPIKTGYFIHNSIFISYHILCGLLLVQSFFCLHSIYYFESLRINLWITET